MSSNAEPSQGVKIFTGEDEDVKEYKRWKTWVRNKLLTLEEKVAKKARGAYVYTLLGGKALETIEHLEASEYQKEGGEDVIFRLLDARFPEKDSTDEMAETLTAVFNLRANEGETLKTWVSRATEQFDKCQRKVNVNFPEEARGWLILNRAGLTDEQRAVVVSRSLGVLKREEISKALRSCYPDFVVPKKKAFGVSIVDEQATEEDFPTGSEGDDFADVEQFLAEHGSGSNVNEEEIYEEDDMREVLAVSWKEKRQELSRLQKNRRFGQAAETKRAFRIEVEELKKKTRCKKCGKIGHWQRECRSKGNAGMQGGSKPSFGGKPSVAPTNKPGDSGAALVEVEDQFVAYVEHQEHVVAFAGSELSLLQRMRSHVQSKKQLVEDECTSDEEDRELEESNPVHETMLVSSPGFGVLDSGCGRSIIGEETLKEFQHLWQEHQMTCPSLIEEINHFRYGNGQRETSTKVVAAPVFLGGRKGVIRAAV